MNSRRPLAFFTIAILSVIVIAPAWANTKSSDSQKATIDLVSTAILNKTTLKPGEYTVVTEGNQAKFERDGKVVVEVPCTIRTLSNKPPYTEVQTDQSRIKEIDIAGKIQAIEFPS